MQQWTGQKIEIFFNAQSPKLVGICKSVHEFGVVVDSGDDGPEVSNKIVATFVPYATIKSVNLMQARSDAEQEAKRKELEERFRRHHLEAAAPPSAEQIEILQKEDAD